MSGLLIYWAIKGQTSSLTAFCYEQLFVCERKKILSESPEGYFSELEHFLQSNAMCAVETGYTVKIQPFCAAWIPLSLTGPKPPKCEAP